MDTKELIIKEVQKIFSLYGYEGISMRKVSGSLGISQSVLYHYFNGKEDMLKAAFEYSGQSLGQNRKKLPRVEGSMELLKQRIVFQFDNSFDVIYILKYFTHYRKDFKKNAKGFVPVEAYTHIKEVLELGISEGVFANECIEIQAKIITHAINGFILEYFPNIPKKPEKIELADQIAEFIYRGIKKGGEKKNG